MTDGEKLRHLLGAIIANDRMVNRIAAKAGVSAEALEELRSRDPGVAYFRRCAPPDLIEAIHRAVAGDRAAMAQLDAHAESFDHPTR